MSVATRQPTIMGLKASTMKQTQAMPAQVAT
jgi:hypothetical protein